MWSSYASVGITMSSTGTWSYACTHTLRSVLFQLTVKRVVFPHQPVLKLEGSKECLQLGFASSHPTSQPTGAFARVFVFPWIATPNNSRILEWQWIPPVGSNARHVGILAVRSYFAKPEEHWHFHRPLNTDWAVFFVECTLPTGLFIPCDRCCLQRVLLQFHVDLVKMKGWPDRVRWQPPRSAVEGELNSQGGWEKSRQSTVKARGELDADATMHRRLQTWMSPKLRMSKNFVDLFFPWGIKFDVHYLLKNCLLTTRQLFSGPFCISSIQNKTQNHKLCIFYIAKCIMWVWWLSSLYFCHYSSSI